MSKKKLTPTAAFYLKKFKLLETYRDIEPFSMDFHPGLNVIVGENGAGKSTLLELLMEQKSKVSKTKVDKIEYKFFDTEKLNPRIRNLDYYQGNYGFALASRFKSHGQTMLPLMQASEDFKDILLFVDEPEAGLSLKSQNKALQSFRKAVKQNCQIILTTHSYVIIKGVPEVYSMDDKKWVSSEDYLSSTSFFDRGE